MINIVQLKHKFLLVLLLIPAFFCHAQLQRFSFSRSKMGSPLNIIFFTEDAPKASAVAEACYAFADSMIYIFSDYEPMSELNRLSAIAGKDSCFHPSEPLLNVLQSSVEAWQASKHTFDITMGTLSTLWRHARKTNVFPPHDSVLSAKQYTGTQYLLIKNDCVRLTKQGIKLDAGAIAKGYIAQQIISLLNKKQITIALVDAGGDIACSGAPPNTAGWVIGIGTPTAGMQKQLTLNNMSVATSGDLYQFIEHSGKRYSHIINPATGYGITRQRKVTVIANDGATADWLASACSILPYPKAKSLVRKYNASLFIEMESKGHIKTKYTRSIKQYLL